MKPRTLQMSSLKIGNRIKCDDGRWGKITHRATSKPRLHKGGTAVDLPVTVTIWVEVEGWGRTTCIEKLATDRMEVGE